MRMNREQELTAATVLNEFSDHEIYEILKNYGEDPFSANITKHIVEARKKEKIRTTLQLVEIIKAAIPARVREKGGHPAKRTFQALRIYVNHELDVLENTLDAMIDSLNEGGRLSVITFHSLEDRIVKEKFRTAENPCQCPKEFPVCVCGRKSLGTVITRKAISPTPEETERNPRA